MKWLSASQATRIPEESVVLIRHTWPKSMSLVKEYDVTHCFGSSIRAYYRTGATTHFAILEKPRKKK